MICCTNRFACDTGASRLCHQGYSIYYLEMTVNTSDEIASYIFCGVEHPCHTYTGFQVRFVLCVNPKVFKFSCNKHLRMRYFDRRMDLKTSVVTMIREITKVNNWLIEHNLA